MALTTAMGVMRRTYLIEHSYISRRLCSSKTDDKRSTTTGPQSSLSRQSQNIRQNVQGYFLTKYINYVANYEKVLEKRFPAAMNVYRTFVIGMRDLYRDMKEFVKVYKIANTSELHLRALTRRELEVYHQLPKDMKKVAPVFLISALPLANYVIFPLAYMYPRTFLSTQFWSIQQKSRFETEFLRERLQYNMRVLRFMQTKLDESKNDPQYKQLKSILGMLGSGLHPSVEQLLEINDVFTRKPFNLVTLPGSHLKNLCGLHGIHKGWRKCMRLAKHAFVIHHIDLAILREGGVHNLPQDVLIHACRARGLNPTNLSTDMMVDWLKQWVDISTKIDGTNISLLLHLPILIGYNSPNNWILLYNR
ncbi:hypothetical protein HA402_009069 [Bradysia odoriphaga]|nr:hypothetical protein HA402_009069 [Bradysia odoriphaga]